MDNEKPQSSPPEYGGATGSAWLPMETAPKDETQVLGWVPSYYQRKGGYALVVWITLEGKTGWYDARAWRCEPSHWMPLPQGPNKEMIRAEKAAAAVAVGLAAGEGAARWARARAEEEQAMAARDARGGVRP